MSKGLMPIHPFPARMSPDIASEVIAHAKRPLRILDPMVGSGTVVATARRAGHFAYGVDIDPLAVLISTVWTRTVNANDVREKCLEVLARAKAHFKSMPLRSAYPPEADEETKGFLRYWFDEYARGQLSSLAHAIAGVRNRVLRDALWCGFSRLIITKQYGASLAMDLSHSRPHKTFRRAPAKPFSNFVEAVERVLSNCLNNGGRGKGPAPRIYLGDARKLPLADESIDLVLTSPPYLNAIDYLRCSKFTLVWMGYTIAELRRLRSNSIGTEAGDWTELDSVSEEIFHSLNLGSNVQPANKAILGRYINDVRVSVGEVSRVLALRGKAVYVIGENTVGGRFIRNARIIAASASRSGLKLIDRRVRMLPRNRRYLPPPLARGYATLDSRMRREVVLTFQKVN